MTWVFAYWTPAPTEALEKAHNRNIYETGQVFGFDSVKLTVTLKRTGIIDQKMKT